MRASTLLALLAFATVAGAAPHPEEGPPLISAHTAANGREIGQVWRMRQRSDGVLVIATSPGLNFFDGTRFVDVAIPGDRTYDVSVRNDRLIVATAVALGEVRPDEKGVWAFNAFERPPDAPDVGPIGRVAQHGTRSFFLSQTYFVTHDRGQWTWRQRVGGGGELRERADGIWLHEIGLGLMRYSEATQAFEPRDNTGLPEGELDFAADDGEPWLARDAERIFERIDGAWRTVPLEESLRQRMVDERIESMARLRNGDIAIGTRFGGLYQLAPDGALRRHIAPARLPGQRITDIMTDREGGVWLTLDGGIARLQPDNSLTRWGRGDGAMQIERLARIDGVLYVAGRTGLMALRPSGGHSPAQLRPYRIDRASVWSLLKTRHGILTGVGNGLALIPPDENAAPVQILSGLRFTSLARHGDYIYGISGNSLRRFREGDAGIEVDPASVALAPGFDLHTDGSGDRLWLSGDGNDGVQSVEQLASWPHVRIRSFGESEGLTAGRITFARDDEGGATLIVADGVFRLSGETLIRDPRFSGELRVMTDALDGQRWAADRYEVKSFRRQADGRYAVAARPLSLVWHPWRHLYRDDDGTLWLAEDRGLMRVAAPADVPALHSNVLLGSVADAVSGETLAGSSAARVDLPSTTRDVRVQAALAAFAENDAVAWSYRLDDGEAATLEKPDVQLPSLSAGTHQLVISAQSVRATRSIAPLILEIDVAPFWFETTAARAAALIAALIAITLLAWSYARWRTRKLEAERVRLEQVIADRTQDIRTQAEEIRVLSEARTRFFAHVSHEFRTPLTLILGPLGDALNERFGALSAPLRSVLGSARENAKRLLKMVSELLDLSRLAAGRFELHVAEHDLAEQLRREIDAFMPRAAGKSITLRGEGLNDPLQLWFDQDQLERMVSNLLGNALKFTPSGGRVTLRLVPTPTEVGIEVEDSGPGIPVEEQAKIFERFYQGGNTPSDAPGTGIGLALVRELIDLHQGRIELVSEPGQGACFVLWLKRGNQHFPPAALDSAAAFVTGVASDDAGLPTLSRPAAGVRPTVLVVDDHSELRRYLADRLGDNYSVMTASDGDEALERIGEALPDIVISDVMMPGMDGLQLAHALRRNPETHGVPLLLLSARSHKRDVVAGLEAGADDYLTKPFDTSELIARIEALLDARRRLRQSFLAAPEPLTPTTLQPPAPAASTEGPADDRFRQRLSDAVSKHLADPTFGVAELAHALHMDRATLFRRCKQTLEATPSEILREHRLQRAEALLRERRGSVSEVAYASGFDNLSYFSQVFRKRYGCAPSALLSETVSTRTP